MESLYQVHPESYIAKQRRRWILQRVLPCQIRMLLQAKDAHSRLLLPKKNPVIMPSQHVQETPSSSAASSNGERTLVNRDQAMIGSALAVHISARGVVITTARHNSACHVKLEKLSGLLVHARLYDERIIYVINKWGSRSSWMSEHNATREIHTRLYVSDNIFQYRP